jgi:hypothetical protein
MQLLISILLSVGVSRGGLPLHPVRVWQTKSNPATCTRSKFTNPQIVSPRFEHSVNLLHAILSSMHHILRSMF